MKAAIHALKYACLHPAAQGLGHLLAQAIAKLADVAPARMLVVPVPLHRSRQSQRGFNQARALARHALQSLAATHPAWQLKLADRTLVRQRLTESQAGLSPRQRRLNLRGAFTVSDPGAVEGKHILLIDDIMTTGATARAAALALRRAGAASVWVATLARAHRAFSTGAAFISDERNDSGEDNDPGMTGNPPDAQVQQGSMHSSMNQPSF
jgi:ComF family protein